MILFIKQEFKNNEIGILQGKTCPFGLGANQCGDWCLFFERKVNGDGPNSKQTVVFHCSPTNHSILVEVANG